MSECTVSRDDTLRGYQVIQHLEIEYTRGLREKKAVDVALNQNYLKDLLARLLEGFTNGK